MIKKSVTYEDFNGNTQTEDLWFHLTKTELIDMEMSADGRITDKLEVLLNNKDSMGMMKFLKDLIIKAYGIKSDDGKRFIKTPQLTTEFEQSIAFDTLYTELVASIDTDFLLTFFYGMLPSDLSANAQQRIAAAGGIDKVMADPAVFKQI